jgi:hypothetical protein
VTDKRVTGIGARSIGRKAASLYKRKRADVNGGPPDSKMTNVE